MLQGCSCCCWPGELLTAYPAFGTQPRSCLCHGCASLHGISWRYASVSADCYCLSVRRPMPLALAILTSAFVLKEASSVPVHILTGISIICTPSRNCVYLCRTGISKPQDFFFLYLRFLAITARTRYRMKPSPVLMVPGARYTSDRGAGVMDLEWTWVQRGEYSSSCLLWLLWELLQCILFESRLVLLASTARFQFPRRAWFTFLVF